MWLLETGKIELQVILDERTLQNEGGYAILSHTWGAEEVSFQDLRGPRGIIQDFAGYKKIRRCCAQAASDGFKYVWIDTCCIDKTNSTELSEAINSMFAWYRNASECYTYLSDILSGSDFTTSKWFTRGWTLQELIAPSSVVFFDQDWKEIGTKASLKHSISAVTGIPLKVLLSNGARDISVAQIMSWAANRETTRSEDIAYCLLGLFDVHMPMIYGEADKAFIRLQNEILKVSDDQSIFAWSGTGHERGPLATCPAEFAKCGEIKRTTSSQMSEYSMTNRGLRIQLLLNDGYLEGSLSVAFLQCESEDGCPVGIYLRKTPTGEYIRTHCREVVKGLKGRMGNRGLGKLTDLYIRQPNPATFEVSKRMQSTRKLRLFTVTYNCGLSVDEKGTLHDKDFWDNQSPGGQMSRLNLEGSGACGGLLFNDRTSEERLAVVIGIDNYTVWSDVETNIGSDESLQDILHSYYEGLPTATSAEISKNRRLEKWERLDRVTKRLWDGRSVKLAIKNVIVSGEKQYNARITIS
jgi:hypothetical protein